MSETERLYLLPLVLGAVCFSIAVAFLILAVLKNDTRWLTGVGIAALAHYLFKESNVYHKWHIGL